MIMTATLLGTLPIPLALAPQILPPVPPHPTEEIVLSRAFSPEKAWSPEVQILGTYVWDGCNLAPSRDRHDAHVRTTYVSDERLPELLDQLDGMGVSGLHLGFHTKPSSLEPLRVWKELTYLSMYGDRLTNDALEPLEDLTALKFLDIGVRPYEENHATDAALVHLSGLEDLRHLGLHAWNIDGSGLAYLSNLTELRELELSETHVDDSSLNALLPMAKLRTLSLQNSRVTDAGLYTLSKLPNLRTLDLRRTDITPAAARILAEFPALEHVVLHYNDQFDIIDVVRAEGIRADGAGWIPGTVGCEHWPRSTEVAENQTSTDQPTPTYDL